MRRRCGVCGIVLGLVALLAAGCSSSRSAGGWDEHRYDNPAGALVTANAAMDLGYAPRWAEDLGLRSNQRVVAAAVLDDLLVTVTQPGNLVAATTLRDGNTLWFKQLGGELEVLYAATRYDGSLYVNSDARVFEVDPYSGEHLGTATLAKPVKSGPVLLADKAIFGAVDGTVFAHSFISGRDRWRYLMTARIDTPPVLVGDNVFAVDGKGTYAMIDGQSGSLAWTGRTFGAITAPPAADRTSVYIASHDNFLYALNRATGEDKWKYAAAQPLTHAPVAIGLGVYLPIPGQLIALDAVDGREPRWVLDEHAIPVTALGDNLLAKTDKGLMLIEVDTGRIVRRVPTRALDRIILGPNDSLITIAPNGKMMRLDPR